MLFYGEKQAAQGDYGLWQCMEPCAAVTYDNRDAVRQMLEAQGFVLDAAGVPSVPAGAALQMRVPTALVPRCPRCGRLMAMNLRADATFVEDEGWHAAARYTEFLRRHEGQRVLFWELGVSGNTPGIVKCPFWRMTAQNPKAVYACVNLTEAYAREEIRRRSIVIQEDIGTVLDRLQAGATMRRPVSGEHLPCKKPVHSPNGACILEVSLLYWNAEISTMY